MSEQEVVTILSKMIDNCVNINEGNYSQKIKDNCIKIVNNSLDFTNKEMSKENINRLINLEIMKQHKEKILNG